MTDDISGDSSMHPLLLALSGGSFVGVLWVLGELAPSLGAWGLVVAGIVQVGVGLAWMAFVVRTDDGPTKNDYPKTYTRERDFQGYHIDVDVVERPMADEAPREILRDVTATAVDDSGDTITQVESTAYAGRIPRYVFDSPFGEGNGMPAGDQTQRVLENVYDDLLEYDSTGSVGDVSRVESALDVVFGEEGGS